MGMLSFDVQCQVQYLNPRKVWTRIAEQDKNQIDMLLQPPGQLYLPQTEFSFPSLADNILKPLIIWLTIQFGMYM